MFFGSPSINLLFLCYFHMNISKHLNSNLPERGGNSFNSLYICSRKINVQVQYRAKHVCISWAVGKMKCAALFLKFLFINHKYCILIFCKDISMCIFSTIFSWVLFNTLHVRGTCALYLERWPYCANIYLLSSQMWICMECNNFRSKYNLTANFWAIESKISSTSPSALHSLAT